MVRATLEDCARADLLCVMELMTYRLDDESPEEFAARKEDLVVDGAVFLQECGTKVLKLEYPGSASGCRRITDAIDVPWAVLSAGVDHEAFCGQLRDADGRRGGRLHRRALAVEGGRRPPLRRAPRVPRRRRPRSHRGAAGDRRRRGVAMAAAAARPRCRHDVLQGARARLGRAGAERGPRADAVGLGPDRRRARSARVARTVHEVAARALADAPRGRRGGGRRRRHGRDRRAARSPRRARRPGDRVARRPRGGRGARDRDRARPDAVRRADRRARLAAVLARASCGGSARTPGRRGRGALARHARVGRALARRRRRRGAVAGLAHGDALAARPRVVARGAGLARRAGELRRRAGPRRHAARARRRRAARGARRRHHRRRARSRGRDGRGGRDRGRRRPALVGDGRRVRAQRPRSRSSASRSPTRSATA